MMNIPDEAVEAAARAMSGAPDKWERLPEKFRSDYRESVRHIFEAAAPHLLASVSTIEELDKLPRFTVIRSAEGVVFERHTMWHEAGSRDLIYSPDIAIPATVLQLGWGEE